MRLPEPLRSAAIGHSPHLTHPEGLVRAIVEFAH
jgi:hypothetical protein